MWGINEISIEIEDADDDVVMVRIETPKGILHVVGSVRRIGRTLYIDETHVQGLKAGDLGRSGLNAIGRKMMVEADVDEIILQGGTRTTGRYAGKRPSRIRFPRSDPAQIA